MQIIKRSEQQVSQWAGGTTTQLAIGPKGSDYASRKFGWRVSTATVTLPKSPFTPLAGVYRHLMVLSGELTLETPQGDQELKPFDQYHFEGGWPIVGKSPEPVIDFNLMTQEGYSGQLESVNVLKEATLANVGDWMGVYVVSGKLEQPALEAGDFLLTEQTALHLVGEATVVIAYIQEV